MPGSYVPYGPVPVPLQIQPAFRARNAQAKSPPPTQRASAPARGRRAASHHPTSAPLPMLAGAVCSRLNSIVTRSADSGLSISGSTQAAACSCIHGAPDRASSTRSMPNSRPNQSAEREQQAAHVIAHPEADGQTEQREHDTHARGRDGDEAERRRDAAGAAPSAATSSIDAGTSIAINAAALPASHAPRATGCVKSSGNSSASPCAALSPSSNDDSDRQYRTACSTHAGADRSAASGVKSGRQADQRAEGEMHVQEAIEAMLGDLAAERGAQRHDVMPAGTSTPPSHRVREHGMRQRERKGLAQARRRQFAA